MTGSYNATSYANNFLPYFNSTSVGALCWYKKDAREGSNRYASWPNAVTKCANGTYADGDATAGWYLPNERELDYLYRNLPDGSLGGSKVGSAATFGGSADAEALVALYYWGSTEYSATNAYVLYFGNGLRTNDGKSSNSYVRCVRRF
jgi:hypothetical protein